MTKPLIVASSVDPFSNSDTLTEDVTIPSNKNSMIIGPVSVPNLTINGHLNIIQSLNITNELNIVGSISFSG